ncbi:uncharacterized protein LOC122071541 [Macadamia integrifolia]|uniref:uncharacterized protein LOC122071541 n=1 Tax=Macadamia integrifolia TaxID=60698 RepID=UPI001C4F2DC6|nr:uncharacterized protein LOC122071541 [Macadamia integrifolia]
MATTLEAKEKKNKSNEEEPVILRLRHRDEEGRKCVEKAEVTTHNPETIKYIERKLCDTGVQRMERHPVDGLPLVHLPKSGHGGKYTWEGPGDYTGNELEAAPPAIDEKDPNYVDEEEEEKILKGEEEEVAGLVVGEVEVAKAVEDREGLGVARVEVRPPPEVL